MSHFICVIVIIVAYMNSMEDYHVFRLIKKKTRNVGSDVECYIIVLKGKRFSFWKGELIGYQIRDNWEVKSFLWLWVAKLLVIEKLWCFRQLRVAKLLMIKGCKVLDPLIWKLGLHYMNGLKCGLSL